MKRRDFSQLMGIAGITAFGRNALAATGTKPNLLIIHTDEHNFRTLGCYRDLMTDDQSYVWGEGVKVDTPHIDSIAKQGAIATSCYSSSPVCSPSRSSLQTGLYPQATAVKKNNIPMLSSVKTFAEVLQEKGYATTYLGKWHLDGSGKPEFAPERHFGWSDDGYMFNRGHWKELVDKGNGAALPPEHYVNGKLTPMWKLPSKESVIGDEKSFTTDFLCDRTIQAIERDKDRPFCVMCSIPDPHGPNKVRSPYNKMYDMEKFKEPRTMNAGKAFPGWVSEGKNWTDGFNEGQRDGLAEYFGMVKCIDDNVGKILSYLKRTGLEENTIVIFTSDHGDLMGEHNRHNKGLPYETSACIPFVIKYPGKIKPGKIIKKANTNTDFAPTILSLMGYEGEMNGCHGEDISEDFTSPEKIVDSERIVYFRHANEKWVAGVSSRYKLVFSTVDNPWLFDLEKDPDEQINFYDRPEYKAIAGKMKAELMVQMKKYGEPVLEKGGLIYETGGSPSAGSSAEKLPTSEGYVVDSGNYSVKGAPGKWSRAVTVPPSAFEPDSTYELEIEWESGGLKDGAEFFANFIDGRKNKKTRQIKTWTGAIGESGVIRKTLKTTQARGWTLHVGVKNGGELLVKRIRMKKK